MAAVLIDHGNNILLFKCGFPLAALFYFTLCNPFRNLCMALWIKAGQFSVILASMSCLAALKSVIKSQWLVCIFELHHVITLARLSVHLLAK